VADASRTMAAHGVGSVVVVSEDGAPVGILTLRDLRDRVLAAGRPPEMPVNAVMSAPLLTVSPEAFVLEALLTMTQHDVHHLAVVEGGRLVGVISSSDLLHLQGAAPLEVSRRIQACESAEALAQVMPTLTETTRVLFAEGVSGYELGRIMAELNDLVVRRVVALTARDLRPAYGDPPVGFCWLALGSEGRREQTLRTDQDNALVYADAPGALGGAADRYFRALAEQTIGVLLRLGYPRCPAEAMASNPRWRQPLEVWRRYFGEWVRDTTPEHLMYCSIYLDFRPVAGDPRLAAALRDEIRAQVRAWRSFPRYLGKLAVSHAPPLGLFGRFRLQRVEGRRGVNLKLGGLLLLNNALRAYAVELGLEETNTLERLEAAARVAGCFTSAEVADLREAYETLFRLRLRHQLDQLAAGQTPDNLVDPATLSRSEQRALREAFRAIRRLQGRVEDRYLTEML
jgi:CBS domain-containing protein